MTFELRFEVPMVAGDQIGVPLTNSPLVINPTIAGKFNWLSPRSGVFTPEEPLALNTCYELTLRPGLTRADGNPAKAFLYRTIATPPFALVACTPNVASTSAASDVQVKLVFNDSIRAADAQPFICFLDAAGHRVPAEVCQGTVEELGYDLGPAVANKVWYAPHRSNGTSGSFSELEPDEHSTNEVANFLVVGPRQNLPLGKGWKLTIAAGIPAQKRPLRSRKLEEIPVGDVTPFKITDATAMNFLRC